MGLTPLPPIPTIVIFPLPVDSTTPPELISTPRFNSPKPLLPVLLPAIPVRLMFPSSELILAPVKKINIPRFPCIPVPPVPSKLIVPAPVVSTKAFPRSTIPLLSLVLSPPSPPSPVMAILPPPNVLTTPPS